MRLGFCGKKTCAFSPNTKSDKLDLKKGAQLTANPWEKKKKTRKNLLKSLP